MTVPDENLPDILSRPLLTISEVCIKTNSANPLSRIQAVGSAGITGSGVFPRAMVSIFWFLQQEGSFSNVVVLLLPFSFSCHVGGSELFLQENRQRFGAMLACLGWIFWKAVTNDDTTWYLVLIG